jgi:hypothetical protein
MYSYSLSPRVLVSVTKDVEIDPNTVADGDILQYDAAQQVWTNITRGNLGIILDDLDDVGIDTNTLADKQLLQYDATAGTWNNVSVPLDDLADVILNAPTEYQTLEFDGTDWVNAHASVVTYVRNADSVTLNTGTVVYLFGATGDHATVKRADNDSDATSSKTVGMVFGSIDPNENGTVVTRGYVRGVNLSSGYAPGDILWLGEDGGFTKVKPAAPEHLVFVGVVVRANSNGIVYVAVQNGYELDELHDVSIDANTLTNGDVLVYDSGTGLWVNGTGGSLVKSDYVAPYSYIGVSPIGTLDSESEWNITRIEIDTGFPVTTATGVAWDNRLTETYS